ncbi:unnamed protein product [Bursaphelenchus okinawaensis]|uniref:Uncharacterized protein n=1 Tax=Bursaphelenchus okinawaensis TaxID=465554 RepID=A0A811L836_9BILA|nr:unnamed protein product [Bursaphelenchus okinawaensis]CAG9117489.1 unnamed protein product [Bursaphelenchus okinawaensis]
MRFNVFALFCIFAILAVVAHGACEDSLCEQICNNFCKVFGKSCGTHQCDGDSCRITCGDGVQQHVLANVNGQQFNFDL